MYESQLVEHKMDIDKLQRELQEVKKKYYLQKKKEHNQKWAREDDEKLNDIMHLFFFREQERALLHSLAPPMIAGNKSDVPRFTGGGFNLKQPQKTTAWTWQQ